MIASMLSVSLVRIVGTGRMLPHEQPAFARRRNPRSKHRTAHMDKQLSNWFND
jgi:hypothetical protein